MNSFLRIFILIIVLLWEPLPINAVNSNPKGCTLTKRCEPCSNEELVLETIFKKKKKISFSQFNCVIIIVVVIYQSPKYRTRVIVELQEVDFNILVVNPT